MHRHVVCNPYFAPVAHRGDFVEERNVLLDRHRPEVLVTALRVIHLDAVEDDVLRDSLVRRLLRLGDHVVLVLQVIRRAVVVERRTRNEPLRLAYLGLLLLVDVPASCGHSWLRIRYETPLLPRDVLAQVVGALAELLHGAFVSVESAMAPGVIAEAEERALELFLPHLLENLELALVGDDVEIGGELPRLERGHGGLKGRRPSVVEHEHERALRAMRPLRDLGVARCRKRRDWRNQCEYHRCRFHSFLF